MFTKVVRIFLNTKLNIKILESYYEFLIIVIVKLNFHSVINSSMKIIPIFFLIQVMFCHFWILVNRYLIWNFSSGLKNFVWSGKKNTAHFCLLSILNELLLAEIRNFILWFHLQRMDSQSISNSCLKLNMVYSSWNIFLYKCMRNPSCLTVHRHQKCAATQLHSTSVNTTILT